MNPYRTPTQTSKEAPPPLDVTDADLLAPFGAIWFVCLLRVGLAAWDGESFGSGLSLAAMMLMLVPVLARDGLRDLFRRWKASLPSNRSR